MVHRQPELVPMGTEVDPAEQVWGTHPVHINEVQDECIAGSPTDVPLSSLVKGAGGYNIRPELAYGPSAISIIDQQNAPHLEVALNIGREIGATRRDMSSVLCINPGGRSLTDDCVEHWTSREFESVRKRGSISPFIYSRHTDAMKDRHGEQVLCSATSTEMVNNKAYALDEMEKWGIPVMRGRSAFSEQEAIQVYETQYQGHKVRIKAGRAATGQGQYDCSSMEEFQNILKQPSIQSCLREDGYKELLPPNTDFTKNNAIGIRIEEYYPPQSAPGIVVCVQDCDTQFLRIAASDQIIEHGGVHRGNVSPMTMNQQEQTQAYDIVARAAQWAHSVGYRGIVGFDIAVNPKQDGSLDMRIMDPNGRITGQTHGAIVAHRLTADSRGGTTPWAVDNKVQVPKNMTIERYWEMLQLSNIAYCPNSQEGVIVMNGATVPHNGCMQVMYVASTRERVLNLGMQLARLQLRESPAVASA